MSLPYPVPEPRLDFACAIHVEIAEPVDMGFGTTGRRRIIPILGGTVKGPKLNGRILPGGADFQILQRDGFTELQARYMIELEDGARIYVENNGMRDAPEDVMKRLIAGEVVDPALIYFRAAPRFEAPPGPHEWLTRKLFVCSAARYPDSVQLRFYTVE